MGANGDDGRSTDLLRLVVRFLYPPGRTVKIIINRESQHTESKNRKEFRGKNKKKTKTKNLN
jgi:hypothetical protein